MKRIKPVNNEIYHVYNRGVEKRKIFLDNQDYARFVHDLFEFNDQNAALNINYYFNRQAQSMEVRLPKIREKRKLLVEVIVFCLMPNHFHLILKQRIDGGITEFMRKLGTGFANYFNKKYERVGPLFQGKFKSVVIKDDSHFLHLPYYVHCNPLDLVTPKWRDGGIEDIKKGSNFLENYRWSSYLDYIGKKNFPSVTQRDFLLKFFGGSVQYKKDMTNWLKNMNIEEIGDLVLE